jgi:hypothetical protein
MRLSQNGRDAVFLLYHKNPLAMHLPNGKKGTGPHAFGNQAPVSFHMMRIIAHRKPDIQARERAGTAAALAGKKAMAHTGKMVQGLKQVIGQPGSGRFGLVSFFDHEV